MKLPLVDLIELVKAFQICVNSHFSHVGSNIYSKSGKYCPCSLSDFTTFFLLFTKLFTDAICIWLCSGGT